MEPNDIIEYMITQIGDLSTWLATMSLAIVGGIVAAFLQIAFHNASKPEQAIKVKFAWGLVIALFIEAFAILAGYIVRASLLTKLGFFQNFSLSQNEDLGRQNLEFIAFTQSMGALQFLLFISGVFLVGVFIFRNQSLIMEKDPSSNKE